MAAAKDENAWIEICQWSMNRARMLFVKEPKRTWRVLEDGQVVGYLNRKRSIEFGIGEHSQRIAMAWAEGYDRVTAEKFALKYPEFNRRHKQTHLL